MTRTTIKVAAASAVAIGALAVGSATIALADDTTSSPSPSASAGTGDSADAGTADGRGQHTAVTGAAADEVIAAVEAKDSAVTIETVRKDRDGSYDALGTKDGEKALYDVSADLGTVTENTVGPGGGRHGGPSSSDDATGSSSTQSDANGMGSASETAYAV